MSESDQKIDPQEQTPKKKTTKRKNKTTQVNNPQAENIRAFAGMLSRLKVPLVLSGFVSLLFYGIHALLIMSKIIPPLPPEDGGRIVHLFLNYGFYFAIVLIVLGFATDSFKNR